ncbi:transmembrane and coiled-coil domains 1 [Rhinolophus ferrumequinum]|uniref:Calcium load-activated calcium channel n=1 Tax=Rhinolophus ferrumequinum TaxID=59479 RepID=A0A7J7T099_RHIFE|nr:transmembrane and coiled-coil domains 1 [Rhinolophus ferrumequinum]
MSTMFADTLLIVFISVCTALLAEGITWVLVYRTDKYKRLKAEVEKQSKKLEKKKETITESAGRQQKKKIEHPEDSWPCPFASCHQAGRWISWPSASFWEVLLKSRRTLEFLSFFFLDLQIRLATIL